MEFKVGDRVTIKSWEQLVNEFGGDEFEISIQRGEGHITNILPEMKEYCGKAHTIVRVTIEEDRPGEVYYHIEEDEGWYWSIDCLITDEITIVTNKIKAEIYETVR